MRRTKKDFIKHYENRYITVEFYDGQRGTIGNGYHMEAVTETATKCSMRGGICFTFPAKYADGIIKFISYIEKEAKIQRIDLDSFQKNIPAIIEKIENKAE